jgi:hypothetical protein
MEDLQHHPLHTRSYSRWTDIVRALPADDGFVISPPYTLKKAKALYAYLRRPDANSIPRRCVYEVLIAACKLFEEQTATSGALIQASSDGLRYGWLLNPVGGQWFGACTRHSLAPGIELMCGGRVGHAARRPSAPHHICLKIARP